MSSNKAVMVQLEGEDDTSRRIAKLEQERLRYPYSPVFQETIALLRKQTPKLVPQPHVVLTMPKEQAEKLYGLLGQVTAHSGFDPIFRSLEDAPFSLLRRRPKLHFVRDNVLTAEF